MSRRLAAAAAAGLALMLADAANAAPFAERSLAFTSFTQSASDVTAMTVFPLTSPLVHGSPFDDFQLVPLPASLSLPSDAADPALVSC
jgi:hypothetical protein